MTMRINEWLDSYRKSPALHEAAISMVDGCVLFDCGEPYVPPTSEADLPVVLPGPPYPNVVFQFVSPLGHPYPGLPFFVFVREGPRHMFYMCLVMRGPLGLWMVSKSHLVRKTPDGESYVLDRNGVQNTLSNIDLSNIDDDEPVDILGGHLILTIRLFAAMACSNVREREHRLPEALNIKRLKKGKLPFLTYKTLEIMVPNERMQSEPMGGTHNSPRLHLRRGHIRKLPDGRTIWVRDCVVGSAHGVVVKDYKVLH